MEKQELTDEQIYEWYARAKINVFDNQNEIIALLARELLAQRGIDAQTYNKS